MSRISSNIKASQSVSIKGTSTSKSKSAVKSRTASSKKTAKSVSTKPETKTTESKKKTVQSSSSEMKKKESVNNEKSAVKKSGVSGSSVGVASTSAKLIQSLPPVLRETATRFLNENDIDTLYRNYQDYKNSNVSDVGVNENYVTSVPSTNMIYTSQGTRSEYTPPCKTQESRNIAEKIIVCTYNESPNSKDLESKIKARDANQTSGIGVSLSSTNRPADSYPTSEQEYDAAKK